MPKTGPPCMTSSSAPALPTFALSSPAPAARGSAPLAGSAGGERGAGEFSAGLPGQSFEGFLASDRASFPPVMQRAPIATATATNADSECAPASATAETEELDDLALSISPGEPATVRVLATFEHLRVPAPRPEQVCGATCPPAPEAVPAGVTGSDQPASRSEPACVDDDALDTDPVDPAPEAPSTNSMLTSGQLAIAPLVVPPPAAASPQSTTSPVAAEDTPRCSSRAPRPSWSGPSRATVPVAAAAATIDVAMSTPVPAATSAGRATGSGIPLPTALVGAAVGEGSLLPPVTAPLTPVRSEVAPVVAPASETDAGADVVAAPGAPSSGSQALPTATPAVRAQPAAPVSAGWEAAEGNAVEVATSAVAGSERAAPRPTSAASAPGSAEFAGPSRATPVGVNAGAATGWKNILLKAYKEDVKIASKLVGIKDASEFGNMPALLHLPFASPDATIAESSATESAASLPAEWVEKLNQLTERAQRLAPARLEVNLPMHNGEDLRVRVSCRNGTVRCEFQNADPEMQRLFLRDWPQLAGAFAKDGAVRVELPSFVHLADPDARQPGQQSDRQSRRESAAERDEDQTLAAFFATQRHAARSAA